MEKVLEKYLNDLLSDDNGGYGHPVGLDNKIKQEIENGTYSIPINIVDELLKKQSKHKPKPSKIKKKMEKELLNVGFVPESDDSLEKNSTLYVFGRYKAYIHMYVGSVRLFIEYNEKDNILIEYWVDRLKYAFEIFGNDTRIDTMLKTINKKIKKYIF